ncbi:MAG TPA: sigma-54 dependent transcriptional regulator [Terriglobia bacterium]|jgi:DNA-binding NtrC family response regulator|nr:sigma-54 dependent transcriptional regulator [Terriglobia bacterium]
MPSKGSILIIDDEQEIRESLEEFLGSEGYALDSAATAEEGLKRAGERPYDLALVDVNLPDGSGIEVLKNLKRESPDTGVIMITAYDSSQTAFHASKEGAESYVTKPWDNDRLLLEVQNLLDRSRLRAENVQWRRALKQYGLPGIVGKSQAMQKVFDLIMQVAPSRATILIQGESGTGKELVAKTIHATSTRADRPFVPVNTGSLPVDLLESTLFGHVRGAFTSAVVSKRGLFEVADQGTIFFDEIGTIGVETQTKLLRVIQEREFMRLGGTDTVKVDVRILAATNVDLRRLVAENRFREDLFYRLNVISLTLPPLRDRKEDIPALLDHFLVRFARENGRSDMHFSPEALKLLLDHDWPGNVRELENAVERAVVLSSGPVLQAGLLPEQVSGNGNHHNTRTGFEELDGHSLFDLLENYQRGVILEMLSRSNWSQTEAAERLRIPLSTLNQKIKRLQIDVKRHRNSETVPGSF